jgi:hypothetical protein
MSSGGKAGNGRGNNRKRQHRRRDRESDWQRGSNSQGRSESIRGERVSFIERPKWIPPKASNDPLPVSVCPWCGKPIRDISSAIADKDTGVPVHFDCVTARIAFGERLEKGETVAYIGGGRFGIVCFGSQGISQNRNEFRDFTIKKIIEWENKEKRAEWRSLICEHFSIT